MFLRLIPNFESLNFGLTFSKMAIISQGHAILITNPKAKYLVCDCLLS